MFPLEGDTFFEMCAVAGIDGEKLRRHLAECMRDSIGLISNEPTVY